MVIVGTSWHLLILRHTHVAQLQQWLSWRLESSVRRLLLVKDGVEVPDINEVVAGATGSKIATAGRWVPL